MRTIQSREFPVVLDKWQEHYQPIGLGLITVLSWQFELRKIQDTAPLTLKQYKKHPNFREMRQLLRESGGVAVEVDRGYTRMRGYSLFLHMSFRVFQFGVCTDTYTTKDLRNEVINFNKDPRKVIPSQIELLACTDGYELPVGNRTLCWIKSKSRSELVKEGEFPARLKYPDLVTVQLISD